MVPGSHARVDCLLTWMRWRLFSTQICTDPTTLKSTTGLVVCGLSAMFSAGLKEKRCSLGKIVVRFLFFNMVTCNERDGP